MDCAVWGWGDWNKETNIKGSKLCKILADFEVCGIGNEMADDHYISN